MNKRHDFHRIPEYLDIQTTSANREPAHVQLFSYDSFENALSCDSRKSPNTISLNGTYLFKLYDSPNSVDDFFRPGYPRDGFNRIQVPSNWEVSGFGEPVYTNVIMPFKKQSKEAYVSPKNDANLDIKTPNIPYENPTGCYLYDFEIPSDFLDKNIFIRFDGVETAYYLWVNGSPCGYAEDSKLASEFNVTDLIKPGKNTIALEVLHFSKSSYLEDQDYWLLSGIFRNVWLYCKPKHFIRDYKIISTPALPFKCGDVTVDVFVNEDDGYSNNTVVTYLLDQNNKIIAESEPAEINQGRNYRVDYCPFHAAARTQMHVNEIELWTPEHPLLYTVVIELRDESENSIEFEATKTGFKKIEIKNGIVYLNDHRMVIHGVNRHDFCYKNGRAVTEDWMIKEIREMKRMNINAVRTCHYPDNTLWYDLCDRYGILLICECNVETHAVAGSLTQDSQWATGFLERAVRMFETHKNHVSIYSWSLGNESGTGPNHAAMAGFLKEADKTRLTQYEAGNPGKNISDIRGNMYAPYESIIKMLCDTEDDRPVILVEYLYQISNAGGGLSKFVQLTRDYKRFQGGYIWDWQDKCLVNKNKNGEDFFAYGGDFNESFVENTCPRFMTCNGIVLPDLTWKPVAYAVQNAYMPISFSSSGTGNVTITSFGVYTKEYECRRIIREDGYIISNEEFRIPDLEPDQQTTVSIGYSIPENSEHDYTCEFVLFNREDTWFKTKEEPVGFCQFDLPVQNLKVTRKPYAGQKTVTETENGIISLQNGNASVRIDSKQADIKSFAINGKDLILSSKICISRAYTGLDCAPGWGWRQETDKARNASIVIDSKSARIIREENFVRTEFDFYVENAYPIEGTFSYEFTNNGELILSLDADVSSSWKFLPRIGLEIELSELFDRFEYLGRGPVENYKDRKEGSYIGRFDSSIKENHFAFVPPAECGGHEDTKQITVYSTTDNEANLFIQSGTRFHFDILKNPPEDYMNAEHDFELPERKQSWLHLDIIHGDIGSNMAWSTVADENGLIRNARYSGKWIISIK